MKKILVLCVVFLAVASQAQVSWDWTTSDSFVNQTLPGDTPSALSGQGWWTEIINYTNSTTTAGSTSHTAGWIPSLGYLIDGNWSFTANEGDGIALRLYNGTTSSGSSYGGESGWYIESSLVSLPTGQSAPPTLSAFDFSSSSWQAVPEPATFLLFGIGGVGAWLVRHNRKKTQFGV